ncbi:MAG: Cytidine deaminase [Candidatus Peregrinibacteria bacterium GW2011_GWA2_33_10]|nr:MAG: Cytidine deaminase [Candidatus Peregrinibacteria bacterium GW2011_GWA2_33_10]KKP40989.1 MAG: cytidine deaminase, cytidine deaminase [Candidatus Peregrinibacteria bacterium GW2011_GWC2_33_13]OGJ50303.1 MAG: hypothetical protein A2229_03695 [Candidatus Peregrinibacteria bacterium RIFOXYA2_FULL_33_7]
MKTTNYKDLPQIHKKMVKKAEEALKYAYNPYSKSYVAAAALTTGGKIITATNFANASTSVNLCAERSVIATANAQGSRKIKAIALIGAKEKGQFKEPITPCGICRQFLFEINRITGEELIVICSNTKKDKIYTFTIHELLPYPYSRYHKIDKKK